MQQIPAPYSCYRSAVPESARPQLCCHPLCSLLMVPSCSAGAALQLPDGARGPSEIRTRHRDSQVPKGSPERPLHLLRPRRPSAGLGGSSQDARGKGWICLIVLCFFFFLPAADGKNLLASPVLLSDLSTLLLQLVRFIVFDHFPYTKHAECGVYLKRRPPRRGNEQQPPK